MRPGSGASRLPRAYQQIPARVHAGGGYESAKALAVAALAMKTVGYLCGCLPKSPAPWKKWRFGAGGTASALGAMEVEADNKPLILNRVKFKVVLVWAANGIV